MERRVVARLEMITMTKGRRRARNAVPVEMDRPFTVVCETLQQLGMRVNESEDLEVLSTTVMKICCRPRGKTMKTPIRGLISIVVLMTFVTVPIALAQESQTANVDAEKAAVRKVLDDQVSAWNRGDLEGFMAGYWKSPDLTFYGGAKITKGWQETLDRYIKGYKSGGREMGQLDFAGLDVQILCADTAFLRGQFHLVMKDGKQPHGVFTLLMKKFPEGWRIVHDHSSGE
jgi:ketosteroid isomerase-like protein